MTNIIGGASILIIKILYRTKSQFILRSKKKRKGFKGFHRLIYGVHKNRAIKHFVIYFKSVPLSEAYE